MTSETLLDRIHHTRNRISKENSCISEGLCYYHFQLESLEADTDSCKPDDCSTPVAWTCHTTRSRAMTSSFRMMSYLLTAKTTCPPISLYVAYKVESQYFRNYTW